MSVASQIELQVGESFSLIVGGQDHFQRYDCCQGEEEEQHEDPHVQLLVVSIPELVRLSKRERERGEVLS